MSLRPYVRTTLLAPALLATTLLAPVPLAPVLLVPMLLVPSAARADDAPPASADGAKQLEGQFKAWLVGLLGPSVPLPDRPIHAAVEGDHYRIGVDVAGDYGAVKVTGDPLSALVKPLDANRWAVDDIRLPSPLHVDNEGATGDQLRSMATKIAEQSAHGVIDLSFASTTSFDSMVRGYTAVTTTSAGDQTTHVDHYTTHTTWQPTGDGRLNMLADGTAEGIASSSTMPDGTPFTLNAKSFLVSAHADRVSFAKFGDAIRTITDLIPLAGLKLDADSGAVPMPARPSLHKLVSLLPDLMGGLDEQYSMKGITVDVGGHTGSLSNFTMGLGFGAPEGRMDVHMLLAADELTSPEIPPGAIAQLVPKHIALKPRVSGVPTRDVMALLSHAIDSNGHDDNQLEMEAMGLLAKGPLQVSIDDLSLDSGPATLHGVGAVNVASPDDISGTAKLQVTGYDALVRQAGADPMLKQGVPVLIFLKGIGRQEGANVVWDIAYSGKKLMVNGTDMSSMIPTGGN
jgi:hypothetical protein